MVFTRRVRTTGNLQSNYVFQNDSELSVWLRTELPKLESVHGTLGISTSDLPGLSVGDTCRVIGEGSDEFVIEKLINYSPYRYGFILDSGWSEEVAKSYILEEL